MLEADRLSVVISADLAQLDTGLSRATAELKALGATGVNSVGAVEAKLKGFSASTSSIANSFKGIGTTATAEFGLIGTSVAPAIKAISGIPVAVNAVTASFGRLSGAASSEFSQIGMAVDPVIKSLAGIPVAVNAAEASFSGLSGAAASELTRLEGSIEGVSLGFREMSAAAQNTSVDLQRALGSSGTGFAALESATARATLGMRGLGDAGQDAAGDISRAFSGVGSSFNNIEQGASRATMGVRELGDASQNVAASVDKLSNSFAGINPAPLGAMVPAARQAGGAVALTTQQLASMQFQMQDVAIMLASGQSPFVTMMQQGSQVVQMFGPGTGVLAAMKSVGAGVMTFLTNPLNIALLGFSAFAGAATTAFSTIVGSAKDADAAISRHDMLVKGLEEEYGRLTDKARDFGEVSAPLTASQKLGVFRDNLKILGQEINDLPDFSEKIAAWQQMGDVPWLEEAAKIREMTEAVRADEMALDDARAAMEQISSTSAFPFIQQMAKAFLDASKGAVEWSQRTQDAAKAASDAGVSASELDKWLKKAAESSDAAGTASGKAAGGFKEFGSGTSEAVAKIQSFIPALDAAAKQEENLLTVTQALAAEQRSLTDLWEIGTISLATYLARIASLGLTYVAAVGNIEKMTSAQKSAADALAEFQNRAADTKLTPQQQEVAALAREYEELKKQIIDAGGSAQEVAGRLASLATAHSTLLKSLGASTTTTKDGVNVYTPSRATSTTQAPSVTTPTVQNGLSGFVGQAVQVFGPTMGGGLQTAATPSFAPSPPVTSPGQQNITIGAPAPSATQITVPPSSSSGAVDPSANAASQALSQLATNAGSASTATTNLGSATSSVGQSLTSIQTASSGVATSLTQAGTAAAQVEQSTAVMGSSVNQVGQAATTAAPAIGQVGQAATSAVPAINQIGAAGTGASAALAQVGGAASSVVPPLGQVGAAASGAAPPLGQLGPAASGAAQAASSLGSALSGVASAASGAASSLSGLGSSAAAAANAMAGAAATARDAAAAAAGSAQAAAASAQASANSAQAAGNASGAAASAPPPAPAQANDNPAPAPAAPATNQDYYNQTGALDPPKVDMMGNPTGFASGGYGTVMGSGAGDGPARIGLSPGERVVVRTPSQEEEVLEQLRKATDSGLRFADLSEELKRRFAATPEEWRGMTDQHQQRFIARNSGSVGGGGRGGSAQERREMLADRGGEFWSSERWKAAMHGGGGGNLPQGVRIHGDGDPRGGRGDGAENELRTANERLKSINDNSLAGLGVTQDQTATLADQTVTLTGQGKILHEILVVLKGIANGIQQAMSSIGAGVAAPASGSGALPTGYALGGGTGHVSTGLIGPGLSGPGRDYIGQGLIGPGLSGPGARNGGLIGPGLTGPSYTGPRTGSGGSGARAPLGGGAPAYGGGAIALTSGYTPEEQARIDASPTANRTRDQNGNLVLYGGSRYGGIHDLTSYGMVAGPGWFASGGVGTVKGSGSGDRPTLSMMSAGENVIVQNRSQQDDFKRMSEDTRGIKEASGREIALLQEISASARAAVQAISQLGNQIAQAVSAGRGGVAAPIAPGGGPLKGMSSASNWQLASVGEGSGVAGSSAGEHSGAAGFTSKHSGPWQPHLLSPEQQEMINASPMANRVWDAAGNLTLYGGSAYGGVPDLTPVGVMAGHGASYRPPGFASGGEGIVRGGGSGDGPARINIAPNERIIVRTPDQHDKLLRDALKASAKNDNGESGSIPSIIATFHINARNEAEGKKNAQAVVQELGNLLESPRAKRRR
jgi:hypothetical protein